VLRALWGSAPEDDEVAGIVRKALDGFKAQGAEVIDITVPGLDDLLRDSSVINDEFKFDLADYLAKIPNAPVKSLGEIIARGLHHAELDVQFRTRNLPEKRETEHYRQAMIKRYALRALVTATLEEHRVDALAYPTLRRKPTLIGEPQGGTNCQLSATTGLPAMAMPAGFSTDGLPIALELLGGAWEEAKLLKYAYAWEQATKPRSRRSARRRSSKALRRRRRQPISRSARPLKLSYDATTGALRYDAATAKDGADRSRAGIDASTQRRRQAGTDRRATARRRIRSPAAAR
jgi:Asp-tRNA(Asn)/Glu-tRNA(Gln) amidotransferase A subunit family amidase